ncbi:hypothetical protein BDV95DRAFT_234009 [Massariosphaeria phaeospora]|uniref:Zn(2)-C6 fungal-type domain-containing protein n=1 Tax=Massariosphaeria phaeospora TaxID=100035 RepID=A0A7C8IGL7_9PLEO|nr:hypothetical protein BDV95DRAFT_234009 [Massariosphaeria phaeospora]
MLSARESDASSYRSISSDLASPTYHHLPRLRPLPPGVRPPPAPTTRKRVRAPAACGPCRTRKSKCSGEHPTCRECVSRKTSCEYPDTETRQVRQKYKDLRDRQNAHEELFKLLKTVSEPDAIEVLRRIRAGGDVHDILSHIKDGSLLMGLSSSSGPELEQ